MARQNGYVITRQALPKALASTVTHIENVEQLPLEGCLFVVIDFDDTHTLQLLHEIRSLPNYQLLPIFYLGHPPEHHAQILDGKFEEKSAGEAQKIQDRMELVKYTPNEKINDFEQLVCSYLFVRNDFILKGFLDYHNTSGFHYPLLDVLGFHQDSQHYWYMLQGMETRKLLKHETLVDEIQTCIHCKSGLLNFKNCCPNCQSIHITTQSFVHCFACGNVGPLSEFLRQEELVCSRCQVKLRHIGIDYDKPMEDKICQDCHYCFFEATVNAVCMVCEKLSDPADLHSKRLYEYRLASRGESLAKGIDQHLIVELSQFLKLIDLSIFMMVVRWQTLLARRYGELLFSLVALKVKNEEQLIAELGMFKTEKLLMEFFERVRSLLRDSDLVARDNKTILFFLPMTPPQGCAIIYERIKAFAAEQTVNEHKIAISIGTMSSSEVLQSNIGSDLLLTELYNRIVDHD